MTLFNDANLKIWLPMTEGTGTTLNNYGQGGSSTYTSGSSSWIKIKDGSYAISQNGTSDYISLGTALSISTGYTICMWIKRDAVAGGTQRGLFHNGVLSGCNPSSTDLYFDATTDELTFGIGCGTAKVTATTTFNITDWYFVCASMNTGTYQKLYVNGILEDEGADTSQTLSNGNNVFGSTIAGGTYYEFNGDIKNFMLFERVLSDNEIKALYKKTYIE